MRTFLGKLFGSDKVITKGVDVLASGIDKLVYTSEEKADDASKERARAREVLIEWVQSTQGQNLARRFLALIITAVWLLMYISATGLNILAVWYDTQAVNLIQAAKVVGERAEQMNGAMMLILGFYFAAPHMGLIVEIALNKFGGKNGKSVSQSKQA